MKIASLVAGLLLTYCASSFAGPHLWSGKDLLQYYHAYMSTKSSSGNSGDVASFATYLGYIRGSYEILAVSGGDMPCVDKSVTLKDIGDVVGHYMLDHPDQLRLPASFIVRKALKDAFPCK
jgi:hypothetical protein